MKKKVKLKDKFELLLPLYKKYRGIFFLAFLFMVGVIIIQLCIPIVTKSIIDDAIGGKNIKLLIRLVTTVVVLFVAIGSFNFVMSIMLERVNNDILVDLRNKMFKKITNYPLSFYTDRNAGDIIARVYGDIAALLGLLPLPFLDIFISAGMAVTSVILIVSIHWKLSLIILLVMPPILINWAIFGKKIKKRGKKIREVESGALSYLTERMNGVLLIKLFAQENNTISKFLKRCIDLRNNNVKMVVLGQVSSLLMTLAMVLASVVIFLYGGLEVIHGYLTIGSMIAFLSYVEYIRGPIVKIGGHVMGIMSAMASLDRVNEYMNYPEGKLGDGHGKQKLENCQGNIRFDNVTFWYLEGRPVLENLNFSIAREEVLSVTGDSGIGKTTISYLLCGLLEPNEGNIFIDGINVKDIDKESLRQQIGFVTQKTVLFNESVEDNIRFGRDYLSRDKIIEAAKVAQIHDYILTLSEGYDTIIGMEGTTLSGGQQQRLALARSIVGNPSILILDEATSNLDYETATLILRDIKEIMKHRTTIFISHQKYDVIKTIKNIDLNQYRRN